jgi:hypothetical protein
VFVALFSYKYLFGVTLMFFQLRQLWRICQVHAFKVRWVADASRNAGFGNS